jgi:hypothetical protein
VYPTNPVVLNISVARKPQTLFWNARETRSLSENPEALVQNPSHFGFVARVKSFSDNL